MSPQRGSGQRPQYPPGHWQLGDYTSLQIQLFVIFTIVLALSLLFTGFRLWSRRIKCLQLMPNDYLALAACFFNFVYFTILLLNIFLGAGRNWKDLSNPFEELQVSLKINIAIAIFWSLVNTLVKLSMADLYTRLFPSRRMLHTAYIFSTFTLANLIFALAVAGLACNVGESATKRETSRRCYMAIGIFNLLLDIAVILMPIPWLWNLQLKLEKRVALIGIFMLGFIITAISAVRVAAFSTALKGGTGRGDYAWNTYAMPLWSYLETSLSVVNACLPVIFPALMVIGRRVSRSLSQLGSSWTKLRSAGSEGTEAERGVSPEGEKRSAGFGKWRRGKLDKTLPAVPSQGTETRDSETRVGGGEEQWKEGFYLEETRVADVESLSDEETVKTGMKTSEDGGSF